MVKLPAAILCLLLGGCSENDPDLIRVALPKAPALLDPRTASDAMSDRINQLLYRPLVTLDDAGQAVPAMADWRETPDGYEFVLRPERAAFANGRKPDAQDVVATYRAVLDPALASPHRSALLHIDLIEALDGRRVRVTLARPDPRLPEKMRIGILPAAHARLRQEAPPAAGGSGPFRLIARGSDETLVLERRRDGQRFRLEPVPDPTMRMLKLLRGEVHLLQNDLPAEMYRYGATRTGIAQVTVPGITFSYLGFNLRDPITADPRIRRAIAHAIDRESIIRYLFLGHARSGESILHPGHWAGNATLQAAAFDPRMAADLLARAGYSTTHPLQLDYKTSTDPFRLRLAAAIQAQLAEVGVELRIRSSDWGTFFGDIKAGRFQMYSLSWVGITSPDILRYVYHSASLPPRGGNRGGYESVEVDRLIDLADRSTKAEAAELYRRVQSIVHNDTVYVPLWYEANVALLSAALSGYRPDRLGSYDALDRVSWRDASAGG